MDDQHLTQAAALRRQDYTVSRDRCEAWRAALTPSSASFGTSGDGSAFSAAS
jgi:hypothetical protein